MRTYAGSPWQRLDPEIREALAPIDEFLRDIGPAFGRIALGQNPDGSGATIGSARLGVSDASTALTDYLYLPGRTSGAQTVNGDVIFAGTVTLTDASVDVARTWDTLQTFLDTTFKVVDDVDPTKTAMFSLGGASAGADLTLAWAGTADRTVTLPNATGTIPTNENANTITGNWVFDLPALGQDVNFKLVPGGAGIGAGALTIEDLLTGFKAELSPGSAGFTADRLITFPNGNGELVNLTATQSLSNKTLATSTALRVATVGTGTHFADQTTTTKRLYPVLSGASANNHSITLTNTGARNYGLGNVSGNLMVVGDDPPAVASGNLGKVDLTGQTAAITSTNLSSTPPAGLYRVEVYVACTTASGAGAPTLDVNVAWTDAVGATNRNVTAEPGATAFPLPLSATGRSSASLLCQVASGDISYSTTINAAAGTPQYAIYIRVVALG